MDPHVKAQALRFARVSALAFLAALATTGGRLSWASLWALGAGALETALRQVLPVNPIPTIASVLAPAPSALGLPDVQGSGVETSKVNIAPATPGAAPLIGIEVPRNPDGTFPPATASNPSVPGEPDGVQIKPET